jgi:SAM-dependent methyltransferase
MEKNTGRKKLEKSPEKDAPLPDYYPAVAEEMLGFCGKQEGKIWMDLGSGSGGLGLALLDKIRNCAMIFMDPDIESLTGISQKAQQRGFPGRAVAVRGAAEEMPMPDESVDVIVSRGSFYFWNDRVIGLREVWRVLCPGGRAMIGGGLGVNYPHWARQEFIRRRRESSSGKDREALEKFKNARSPETFRRLAIQAQLASYEITGEGGLDYGETDAGTGIWLKIRKER